MLQAADVLAGPILRRVEKDLVSVWIALTRPAKVELEIFRGQGAAGTLGPPVARKAAQFPVDTHTIAAGAKLHVAVSIWEPASVAGLDFGEMHSYDVRITTDDGDSAGLAELGLLQDHADDPAWLALGYQQGWLPSFATVPAKVADLKIAQGSCRAGDGSGRDAMPPLDDLIRSVLTDPKQRPHMLYLTGDQIYADEAAAEQLDMLQALTGFLLGGREGASVEEIPVDFKKSGAEPAATVFFPVDATHLPPTRRGHVLNDIGGFSSTSTDSHVMGFGEYCGLYLQGWSTISWKWKPRELLAARKEVFQDYLRACGHAHRKLELHLERDPKADREALEARVPYHDGWRLVPKRYRALDALLSDDDRDVAWGKGGKGDEKEDDETFRAWKDFWGPVPDDPPTPRGDEKLAELPASARTPKERNRLARALTPSWYAGVHYCGIRHEKADDLVDPATRHLTARSDQVLNRVRRLEWFHRDVPRVRRLLANVPTYMVFDDHEISDDWNVTPRWAKRTRASALGRAVIRNGLAACTLFQSWGNDPRAYRPGSVGRKVLDRIEKLFAGATPAKPGPDRTAATELEKLFDLLPPTANAERMIWHFRYVGPGFEVLTLDSRTWRGFEPEANEQIRAKFSDDATATLLTDEALRLQVPEQPAQGVNPDGVCFVIAAAPFLGYPIVESVVQPLINLHDIAKSMRPAPPFLRWKKSFAVGRVARDPENWGFVPALFEAVLARLASRRRVVILSGDVHYAFTLSMAYWQMDPDWAPRAATRVVQLTASSFRAQRNDLAPLVAIDLAQQLGGLSSDQERLGWRRGRFGTPEAEPPIVRGADPFTPHLELTLEEDPIVVSPRGVPPTATYVRGPEWYWTTKLVSDSRPDEVRLLALHPPPFSNASEIDRVRSVAERHLWNAQNAMPRGWQWWTNFTLLDFTAKADGSLDAIRHRIFGFDPQGLELTMQPFVIAEVPLDVLEPPPIPPPPPEPRP